MSSLRSHGGPVMVRGYGLVTSLGVGVDASFEGLIAGRSGVKTITRFSPQGLQTHIAATIDFPQITAGENIAQSRIRALAERVIDEAVEMGGLSAAQLRRCRLFSALPSMLPHIDYVLKLQARLRYSSEENFFQQIDLERDKLAAGLPVMVDQCQTGKMVYELHRKYRLASYPLSANTACSSSATAMRLAVQAIRRGEIDYALVLTAESSISPEAIARFNRLAALSTANAEPEKASRPFDIDRDGFVMGEGAAAVILQAMPESGNHSARGFVLGAASSTDNFHITRSNPNGEKIAECMKKSILDADLDSTLLDCINAHGTSTPENDKTEGLGIHLAFGERAEDILVTSNKSMIGHCTCAAGLVEVVISLESLYKQRIPPTLNCVQQDEDVNLNIVTLDSSGGGESFDLRTVLSNSFAFGGQNESLVLARNKDGS